MYQTHGWWLPDQDTHFERMLNKSVLKGHGPHYQREARVKSVAFVKEKLVALDIGANVGLWARDLCEQFDQVIAFEPVKEFVDCLVKNVPAENLVVMDCALGGVNDTIDMTITEGNTGHTHVNKESFGQGNIQIKKLDDLDIPAFQYCKIDCEGYEVPILEGAKETILRNKPIMVVEQKAHADLGKTDQYDAVKLLQSWGAKRIGNYRHDIILGW